MAPEQTVLWPFHKGQGRRWFELPCVKLAGSSYVPFLRSCMHRILKNTTPPKWSHSLLAPFLKKGDSRDPQNYCSILFIQSLQTWTAAFLYNELLQSSETLSVNHKREHGALKNHRCVDHIYYVVDRKIQMGGPPDHLYIDFNKALNSVPHETLLSVPGAQQFPDPMTDAFENLYSNPVDKQFVHGTPDSSYIVQRCVHRGCPISHALFILFINVSLFNITWLSFHSAHYSLHVFINDILFQSNST